MEQIVVILSILLLVCIGIIAYGWYNRTPTYHYTINQGKDSPGGDLYNTRLPLDEKSLQMVCNADNKCVGYNTSGWLKSSIQPQDKWVASPGSLNVKGAKKWW